MAASGPDPSPHPRQDEVVSRSWKVIDRYRGWDRKIHACDPANAATVRSFVGSDDHASPVVVLQYGDAFPTNAVEIQTEDGRTIEVPKTVDDSVPLGYHTLIRSSNTDSTDLIISPGMCHRPEQAHGWGLAAQLYSARSRQSWGIGDSHDLATMAQWCTTHGASFVSINPMHATPMIQPIECSPYQPSSRIWRNPIYLHVEDIAGADSLATLEQLVAAGRVLNTTSRIDYDSAAQIKMEALRVLWKRQRRRSDPRFDEFVQIHGTPLRDYGTYCALSELYGQHWDSWPRQFRDRSSPAVARFHNERGDDVLFHMWLQFQLHLQFDSDQPVRVMNDLAIGVSRFGADTWALPDLFAMDYSIGAPPDEFTALGQDWGMPPINPVALRQRSYRPFVDVVRSALQPGGALRIDHVIGLFRMWWIPISDDATHGVYLRYPARDLLNILALESQRSQCWIIGEALGTVEAHVRPELSRRHILAYKLLLREGRSTVANYPKESLTVVLTHDHPTLRGLWDESDITEQIALGLKPNVRGTAARKRRISFLTGLPPSASAQEVTIATHRLLAQSPSRLVGVSLADIALQRDRSNLPGTTNDIRDNWRIPLPAPLDDVLSSDLASTIASVMSDAHDSS